MSFNQIEVSICIPTYNNGKYIGETLESLINQTYKNIEIIISDNASTDNTKDVVENIIKKDSRVHYYNNSENIGYVNNIARAVSLAKNDIIAIYHSDDIYDSTTVEKELDVLISDDSIGCVFVKHAIFSTNVKKRKIWGDYSKLYNYKNIYNYNKKSFIGTFEDYLDIFFCVGNIFSCPSLMTRKLYYKQIGGYKDNYPSNEDFELWVRYLMAGYKIAIVDEPLLYYRKTDSQGSAYWENLPKLPAMYNVIDDLLIDEKIKIRNSYICYLKRKSYAFIRTSYNAYKAGDSNLAASFIKKSKEIYKFKFYEINYIFQNFKSFYYLLLKLKAFLKNKVL